MSTTERFLAWCALAVPLAVSLAAQVVWAWRTGSVVLGVWGAVATLILALSIHRWRRLPPLTGSRLRLRNLTMGGVVLAVGGWTWLHTSLLLISELPPEPNRLVHGLSVALCIAAFLPIEGLAVLSVLSLDDARSTRSTHPGPEVDDAPVDAVDEPGTPPWGPPGSVDTIDAPVVPATVSTLRTRPPGPRPPDSSTTPSWTEPMAAVDRRPGERPRDWVRRRASALDLPQSTSAEQVRAAELDRARAPRRSTPGSTSAEDSDDREGVPA